MNMRIRLFVALLAGLTGLSLAAQADTAVKPSGPAAASAPVVVTVVASNAAPVSPAVEAPAKGAAPVVEHKPGEGGSDEIVIDYNEADIQRVLRTLATKAGVNLITGDEVSGKVTVHLEGVGYEEALRLIIESKGYAFAKEKNVVRVKSKESLDSEPPEIRVIVLNYAKADEVKKSLDAVVSGRGKIQVDQRINALIISDTPASLGKLVPLIQSLDTQTPQVMIEAKFIETTRNPKKDLGINWAGTLVNHEVSAGGNGGPGLPVDFNFTKTIRPGAPWAMSSALLDVGQANMVFSYMNQDSDTELLANPRVVTTDNTHAKIAIAEQYPIPSFTFSEQTASLQVSGFDYKDIGIILNVMPRINKNDFVTLEVAPEASSSSANSTLQSGGGSAVLIPIIDTRTATTTVLIKSGNTLAIGGLMRFDNSESYAKVPLLGDMPGVGTLFRNKSLNKTKRDLLIFLTPTIIAPDGQTGYEVNAGGIKREEIYTDDKWMPKDNATPRSLFKNNP